jgi:hypothetical protein
MPHSAGKVVIAIGLSRPRALLGSAITSLHRRFAADKDAQLCASANLWPARAPTRLRDTEGLLRSSIAGVLKTGIPDHTTLSRCSGGLTTLPKRIDRIEQPLHLLADSTGLKILWRGRMARLAPDPLTRKPSSGEHNRRSIPARGRLSRSWPGEAQQTLV